MSCPCLCSKICYKLRWTQPAHTSIQPEDKRFIWRILRSLNKIVEQSPSSLCIHRHISCILVKLCYPCLPWHTYDLILLPLIACWASMHWRTGSILGSWILFSLNIFPGYCQLIELKRLVGLVSSVCVCNTEVEQGPKYQEVSFHLDRMRVHGCLVSWARLPLVNLYL